MTGVVISTGTGQSYRTSAAKRGGLISPVPSGLEGLFLMEGSDLTLLGKNWAAGKADAALVGTPTMGGSNYGTNLTSGSAYLQSAIAESDNMTILAVVENAAKAAWPITNYPSTRPGDSVNSNGIGLQMTRSGSGPYTQGFNGFMSRYSGTPGAATALVGPSGASFASPTGNRAVSLRVAEPSGVATFDDLTGATKTTATRPSGVRDKGSAALRLGGSYSADGQTQTLYYAFAIWSRALTDAELSTFYTWLKAYWLRRSITI